MIAIIYYEDSGHISLVQQLSHSRYEIVSGNGEFFSANFGNWCSAGIAERVFWF